MHGDQQVGTINSLPTGLHAAIWSGTAQSFRDVHPFTNQGSFSQLFATCGSAQVGLYNRGTGVKPGIWFGSRDSFLDLYQFLPPGAGESAALCVEEVNGVFTVGGYARYGVNYRPFVWVGVPAPSSVQRAGERSSAPYCAKPAATRPSEDTTEARLVGGLGEPS